MKAILVTLLLIPLSFLYSQVPNTIVVKTMRIKGFGPFNPIGSQLPTMDTSNNVPWPRTIPRVKGLPPDHRSMLYNILIVDFFQFVYQNYFAGNIPEADYNDLKNKWDWDASPGRFYEGTCGMSCGCGTTVPRQSSCTRVASGRLSVTGYPGE